MIYMYITYRISSSYIVANISSIASWGAPGVTSRSKLDPGFRGRERVQHAAWSREATRWDRRSRVAMAAMAAMAIEKHQKRPLS